MKVIAVFANRRPASDKALGIGIIKSFMQQLYSRLTVHTLAEPRTSLRLVLGGGVRPHQLHFADAFDRLVLQGMRTVGVLGSKKLNRQEQGRRSMVWVPKFIMHAFQSIKHAWNQSLFLVLVKSLLHRTS